MGRHKKQMKTIYMLAFFAVVFLFAGCGGQSSQSGSEGGVDGVSGMAVSGSAVSGNAISGSAVSGSAVSESAIQEQTAESEIISEKELFKRTKKQPYANDYHLFEGDKLEGIYQYSLTGEEEKFYETGWLSCPDVVWVDNECILYFCDYDDGDTPNRFYYAPLAGGKGKNQILLNQKVLLSEAGALTNFVAKRGDNVFFGKNEKLFRVNIKTKKSEKLEVGGAKYVEVLCDFNGQPCIQNDKAYFQASDKNIYEYDLKQCKARKLGEKLNKEGYWSEELQIALDEQYMYYASPKMEDDYGDEIVKVSLATGEKTILWTMEDIEKLINKYGSKEFAGKKFGFYGSVIRWKDRLCFVLSIHYHSGSPDLLYEEEHLVFQCSAEDGSELTFENEMAELEKKEIQPYLEEDMEDVWKIQNGSIVSVIGENQFVIEYEEGEQGYDEVGNTINGETETRFILYDTKTNRAKKIGEGSAEYGLLRASGYEVYEAYDRAHF